MTYQERRQKILEIIEKTGFVEIKDLILPLKSSDRTLRRVLDSMADEGAVVRTFGGAMRASLAQIPVGFTQKAALRSEQKEAICKLAAARIQPGQVVFLDCGSTVFKMCNYIRHLDITVITNSLPVVNELLGSSVRVNFVGGELDHERLAMHGQAALEHVKKYHAHHAFIGVGGLSLAHGLSANSEKEAEMSLAIAACAEQTWYLCDSAKLGHAQYLPFAPLSAVQNLITDAGISALLKSSFEQNGVRVLCG
jgi:DeoR family transcriptional regulator, fructose operon transcriptional repressor